MQTLKLLPENKGRLDDATDRLKDVIRRETQTAYLKFINNADHSIHRDPKNF